MPYKNKAPNVSGASNSSAFRGNMHAAGGSGVMASVGVRNYQGRVRDRVRRTPGRNKKQKFYNKRLIIPTGKDLTTPLRAPAHRQAAGVSTRAKAGARTKAKIEVKTTVRTIKKAKERFPTAVILHVAAATIVFLCLVYSRMVLHEYFVKISEVNGNIAKYQKDEAFLLRQLELHNKDIDFEGIAVNELGMAKEELLFKKYISVKYQDKVEIVEENEKILPKFAEWVSSFFSALKK